MKKTRVLVLFDTDGEPPASQDYKKQLESADEAEFDVARALIAEGPRGPPLRLPATISIS